MQAIKNLVAVAILAAALPAVAAKVVLNFESVPTDGTLIGETYSASGIHFGAGAWSFKSQSGSCGGTGKFFGGNTDEVGCGAAELVSSLTGGTGTGISLVISVDKGFTGLFSMLYAASSAATMSLYSSADFVDANLISTDRVLGRTPTCIGALDFKCNWATKTVDLGGKTAQFVVISGVDASMFFDNVTFGDVNAGGGGTDVPEPAGLALSLAALGALAWTRKRLQR